MTHAASEILLVEDEDIIAMILENALTRNGYRVTLAGDGQAAWELLEDAPERFNAILLDREMPRMDGMTLLRKLKGHPTLGTIPVIMETAAGDLQSVREGLDAGAFYYLTKPFQAGLMLSVVNAAVSQLQEQRQLRESLRHAEHSFAFLDHCRFRFRTLEDGRMIANLLARFCPDPEKLVLGLQELFFNAIEHGNLAISYADKTRLLVDGAWEAEIERRLGLPEYASRQVQVEFERDEQAIRFTIRDEGQGFDWRPYLDFDPARAFDPHGRGIAIARRFSFSALEYQGRGNTVVATIKLNAPARGEAHD